MFDQPSNAKKKKTEEEEQNPKSQEKHFTLYLYHPLYFSTYFEIINVIVIRRYTKPLYLRTITSVYSICAKIMTKVQRFRKPFYQIMRMA
jgi:hypothetical protein